MFEENLHGMSPHLIDLTAFWRARSTNLSPTSPDATSCKSYTWKIDTAIASKNRETISESIQALGMYVQDEKRPKGKWERLLVGLKRS
jgi:hypothetical protein